MTGDRTLLQPPILLPQHRLTLRIGSSRHLRGEPVLQRILYRMAAGGVDITDRDACWPWPGARNGAGYARIGAEPGGENYVHRIMFRECWGPLPDGCDVDHTCHTRAPGCPGGVVCPHRSCGNPWHLDAVDHPENRRRARLDVRGARCRSGRHPYEPQVSGQRNCRRCYNEYMRAYNLEYRARRKAAGQPLS